MKYFIFTTGCKSNQYDSYVMDQKLRKIGIPSSVELADYVIINACTLTSKAERDIRRFIGRVRKERKDVSIVLTGCHPQVYVERTFGADLILGQKEKFHIERYLGEKGTFVESTRNFPMDEWAIEEIDRKKTRFFLKIQDGCDSCCSYCVVPLARGKRRNRPYIEIMEIMKILKEKGIKEVVLTGMEIGTYRDGNIDLKSLLKNLEFHETPQRIRISSIDPVYIDEDLIKVLKASQKIAKSIHIPLQSASDKVLEAMGRSYRKKDVEDKVTSILDEIKNIGIGFDVLTGFPVEDEKAFEETKAFIESKGVYYLHVFPFSRRQKTAAFDLGDMEEHVKRERVSILKKLDSEKRSKFYEKFKGETFSVLFEGKIYHGGFIRGYTENYIPIYVPFENSLLNNMKTVRLKEIVNGLPLGEIV